MQFNHQSKRVKVTPGTTMFQVLTEARDHFGLSDSRQFQLLHRSKPVDLSIPFRLTGISNNASVELKELEGEAEVQQVRVCVQLRDGKRVQASFGSDATLERILKFFKLLPAPEQFSLGFLRREIESRDFATTTLKELGILSGSGMFRVQAADRESNTTSANVPSVPESPFQNSSTFTQKPHVAFATASTAASNNPMPETLGIPVVSQSEDIETKDAVEDKEGDVDAKVMSSYDALQLLRNSNFDAVSRAAVMTLMKIVTNILSDLGNEKVRSIRLTNAAFHRSVGGAKGGLDFLRAVGFAVVSETQTLVLKPSPSDKSVLEEGFRLLNVEADDLNISVDTRPVVREKKEDPNFDVFKTQITRVQMQPRGPSTTEVLVGALKSKQDQLIGHEKPPRDTTISLEGKRGSVRPVDTFVENELSERSDAQLLISSLKARREEMEKTKHVHQNFRTQAMRELDELKRKKVFQSALIRVQFPDRAVLQASFHPNETIQDVMDHVTECLADQYQTSKFHLYVTPPMQKLAAMKTLAELNLLPAALMYLSWSVTPQTEMANAGFYFRSNLLANEHAESKETVDSLQKAAYPKPLHLGPGPRVGPAQPAPAAEAKTGKKPAWLKL
ncbi:Tether containing UBX domain for GLUT4 [Phytophthora citrophthora]|uniref:Tether containing UBX domain for GLUT4 n=1 Tax=Phytophthora citrophthora TaxID=4793 RepID=A0AAD9LK93_9STRA|nr:Tether containing UBX domain for GLUT4 [Phytophthora citrophthora]